MGKLSNGVLRILTPLGPRFIKPLFWERLYLLWIFRHFEVLPLQVLTPRQRRLIDTLCTRQRFVSLQESNGLQDAPVLGTVERRPPVETEPLPPDRANARGAKAGASVVGGLQQRS
ncbi:MAG TPA: hypothetical protein VH744_01985 [Terriglobales bacterium]